MYKPVIAGAVIALGFLGWPGAESASPSLELSEERMTLEFNPAADEAALVVSAESEVGLERVEVRKPSGAAVLKVRNFDGGSMGLHEFTVKKGEGSAAGFFAAYPEGDYVLSARTVDGEIAVGSAPFSHALLPAPIMIYPAHSASDVPTTDVSVSWASYAGAVAYRVTLEKGETDLMTVELGGGTGSFPIPDGLLAPRTRYWVEIAAIAPNGNATLLRVPFMTM